MRHKDLFLLGFYSKVPRDPKKTSAKNFGANADNWSFNEHVHFTRGLKDKDLTSANVILNISGKKLIKCSFNPDNNFENLFQYYKESYPQYVKILEDGLMENTPKEPQEVTPKEITQEEANEEKPK